MLRNASQRLLRSPAGFASVSRPRNLRRSFGARPARGDYAKLTSEHVKELRSFVGSAKSVISTLDGSAEASDLTTFNEDVRPSCSSSSRTQWMGKYAGETQVVLKPRSTDEVSKILAYCAKNRIAVVPQGGNTGLVGGSVPVYDEVVISLQGMNRIRSFDEVSGILVVRRQASCADLAGRCWRCPADAGRGDCQEGVRWRPIPSSDAPSYLMPLDLGAKGSCAIVRPHQSPFLTHAGRQRRNERWRATTTTLWLAAWLCPRP